MDRVFGIRLGTIIYMFILMVGQLIFAIGGLIDTFWLMVLGRFIFGYVFVLNLTRFSYSKNIFGFKYFSTANKFSTAK